MNQLVRENLYYGENDSANSTYTYSYDSYVNILGKYYYAYTTDSLADKLGITVAEYQYTDSQWGDLLTAVTDGTVSTGSKQNNTVSYDEMGNPTRYFGAAMTWAGKQLKYWGKSGKYVNFAYNEDGIRTQKNSDGILTNYYYNGSLLIGMTVGSGSSTRILRFSYDSSGSVVAVDYSTDNGTTFNTYYYLRNAQNDIVKLIDSSGSTVVEYCYDSWENLCQPQVQSLPHSERITRSATVDTCSMRKRGSITSKAGTITPKSAGLFLRMIQSILVQTAAH